MINNKPIPVYGDGENIRDWLFVEDHCNAIELIFNKSLGGETYNVGSNNEISNNEIIDIIHNLLKNKVNTKKKIKYVNDRFGQTLDIVLIQKIIKTLGWKYENNFIRNLMYNRSYIKMKKITIVAGARPNFMKIGPIINEIKNINKNQPVLDYSLVHTGQHYDKNMSKNFFLDLGIPEPDINLGCGGGNQSEITAKIMIGFQDYLQKNKTDLVIVVGDVTSTMACSIVAKKMFIPVSHIEAGIRSGDMKMPEEINRIVTDSISDYFFTTTKRAGKLLESQGANKIKYFLLVIQ